MMGLVLMFLLLLMCYSASAKASTVPTSRVKSLQGTFTMTYSGSTHRFSYSWLTPVGYHITKYRGMWSKDQTSNMFLKIRETVLQKGFTWNGKSLEGEKELKINTDEFELYVPDGKGSFSLVSEFQFYYRKSNVAKD